MPLPKKKKFLQEIVEPEKKIPEAVVETEEVEEDDVIMTTSKKSKMDILQEIVNDENE